MSELPEGHPLKRLITVLKELRPELNFWVYGYEDSDPIKRLHWQDPTNPKATIIEMYVTLLPRSSGDRGPVLASSKAFKKLLEVLLRPLEKAFKVTYIKPSATLIFVFKGVLYTLEPQMDETIIVTAKDSE